MTLKRLNWFQNWAARKLGLTDLDFNAALWHTWRTAMRLGIEKGEAQATQSRLLAIVPPPPQTTGPLPQVTGPLPALGARNRARQHAFLQQLNSQPSGAMARIHTQMGRQKQITGQLGVETVRLPAVSPSMVTRPLRAMIYEDLDSEFDERTNAS